MKIKGGCAVTSEDFWYDLAYGGYIKPEDCLEDALDAEKVNAAVKILKEFEKACEDQIGNLE